MADLPNSWSQGIGSIQPSVKLEFAGVPSITLSSVAYYAGLIFGAFFWGTAADLIGRKPAFNTTLIIGGVFGTAVAGLSNFNAFCVFWAIIGTAAGGNVPVDSMIFLEFVPGSHQYLLTVSTQHFEMENLQLTNFRLSAVGGCWDRSSSLYSLGRFWPTFLAQQPQHQQHAV